ncbi:WD40-repeat-containing domain protein [Tricharina praecox]|uniref:WD40-repeat-containing domain protein n=1 Tax=Tricharina praecox TaxID=43433 RepID=UPI0022210D2F|nr:WD40-repeat-containing domain protein [Tricharina praecox]KAI5852124.1 WD40-repeat-containing domain protein [Tricharina praecox]
MSISADPGHFFQTATSLATISRRLAKAHNQNGRPLVASSKILCLLADPTDFDAVFIGESCGIVRRVTLEAGNTKSALYRGFSTPCTCLALNSTGRILFAGAWEKKIIAWDVRSRKVLATFVGHADFVKSLLYLPTGEGVGGGGGGDAGLLLSGSSDANIIIWAAGTGQRIATLKGHTRAVGAMAVDPVASSEEEVVVLAGGSERDIRRWRIPVRNPAGAKEDEDLIREFETSVHALRFLGEDADCWGASADGTARRLEVRVLKELGERTDTVLKHPDYVNDVVMAGNGRWVVTACRDEEVRVWDVVSGELYHTFTGHADEVVALAVVGDRGEWLISAGIDCTIRRWSLLPKDLEVAREEARKAREGEEPEEKVEEKKEGVMTAEEEAELADLMDSD